MNDLIPLSVPSIKGNEWNYIKECLDSEWVSSAGKYVDYFENKIASYTGAKYAIACVNGTSALHTALIIAGVQPDDEVIVPTLTFIAPINAVRYCGAAPVFMDADKYYNIDSDKFIDFILKETKFIKTTKGELGTLIIRKQVNEYRRSFQYIFLEMLFGWMIFIHYVKKEIL
jgi:perosamine synthetase